MGALYTREHFEAVKAHLKPGGVYAQWLPLWQLSRREFDIIAATFLSVFDNVTLWRGVFNPDRTTLALIAFADDRPIDLENVEQRLGDLRVADPFPDSFLGSLTGFMLLYAGDLSSQAPKLSTVPLNSDDRPRIEWLAPRTLQAVQHGEATWLTGRQLADLYDEINRQPFTPGDRLIGGARDPSIYRLAAARFYRAEVMAAAGSPAPAEQLRREAYEMLERGPEGGG